MKKTYIKPALTTTAVAPSEPIMKISGIMDPTGPNIIGEKTTSKDHPLATRHQSLWDDCGE